MCRPRSPRLTAFGVFAAAAERFATGVTLFGYTLPTAIELAITCAFAVVFLTVAVSGFGKPE